MSRPYSIEEHPEDARVRRLFANKTDAELVAFADKIINGLGVSPRSQLGMDLAREALRRGLAVKP